MSAYPPRSGKLFFRRKRVPRALRIEPLESRFAPTVTASVIANVLHIDSDAASDVIGLRLQSDDATKLQVDVGNNGSTEHTFDRATFAFIDFAGGDGNDTLLISDANGVFTDTEFTTIIGGAGNDSIVGGSAGESITGDDGNDTLSAGGGNNNVLGGAGNDSLLGGDGNDSLWGEDGHDRLDGGAGNDRLSGLTGNDTVSGGTGNDTLANDDGNDSLLGNEGNDSLDGGAGNDSLSGGVGDDSIAGGLDTDRLIEAGDNDFTLTNSTLGGLGADNLSGIEEASLTGGIGNNVISASAFTAGSVTLSGGTGDDSIVGGSGADSLVGNTGRDTLSGNAGNDSLTGGSDADSLAGGDDTDRVVESSELDLILTDSFLLGDSNDTLSGIEQASLTGGFDDNLVDASWFSGPVTLNGGYGGSDTLLGTANNDWLAGADGDDSLAGGLGHDTLDGGAGNDTFAPGTGNDSVAGGTDNDEVVESGASRFVLTTTSLSGAGNDTLNSIEGVKLTGTNGNDTINATGWTLPGGVTMSGGLGNDLLSGSTSNNDLLSESGDVNFTLTNNSLSGLGTDTLSGIERASLTGGPSANVLNASAFSLGSVSLSGAEGNDTFMGGADAVVVETGDTSFVLTNSILTGLGTDSLNAIHAVFLTGGDGDNRIDASAFTGTVSLSGGSGNNSLIGGSGDDSLFATSQDDTLLGNDGADFLFFGSVVFGGNGDDYIVNANNFASGDSGNDTLSYGGFLEIVYEGGVVLPKIRTSG